MFSYLPVGAQFPSSKSPNGPGITHTHTACFTCHQTWHRMALLQQNNRCRCAQTKEPSRMMLLFSCTVSSVSCFVPVLRPISEAASGTAVSSGSVLEARPVPSESRMCVSSHPSTVSLVLGFFRVHLVSCVCCSSEVRQARQLPASSFLGWRAVWTRLVWLSLSVDLISLKGSGSYRRRRRLHKLLPLVCINTVQLFGLRNVSATFQHLQVDASRCVWYSEPAWLFPTQM